MDDRMLVVSMNMGQATTDKVAFEVVIQGGATFAFEMDRDLLATLLRTFSEQVEPLREPTPPDRKH